MRLCFNLLSWAFWSSKIPSIKKIWTYRKRSWNPMLNESRLSPRRCKIVWLIFLLTWSFEVVQTHSEPLCWYRGSHKGDPLCVSACKITSRGYLTEMSRLSVCKLDLTFGWCVSEDPVRCRVECEIVWMSGSPNQFKAYQRPSYRPIPNRHVLDGH